MRDREIKKSSLDLTGEPMDDDYDIERFETTQEYDFWVMNVGINKALETLWGYAEDIRNKTRFNSAIDDPEEWTTDTIVLAHGFCAVMRARQESKIND